MKGKNMIKGLKIFMAILLLSVMVLPCEAADSILQIRGSDTMLNLTQKMIEVYIKKNPGGNAAVTGGGSGTGIAGLRNRTVDIANSSRDITGRELTDSQLFGVRPVQIVVGIDCITIIVNKKNKVAKLTIDQLGAIYRGEITNWKDIGGDDAPITLYGRQSNSGTFFVFRERVLKGEYSDTMRTMNGNSQIVESVKADASGIGYVGRGYAVDNPDIGVISIAFSGSAEYVNPLEITENDAKRYPIVRTLNQYVAGKPEGTIRDFILFELSDEGQAICEDMGFFKVSEEEMRQNKQALAD